ncbi:AraC family transcriptional regulator [Cellulosilyticum ruminicola]|uniref:AraC family transcriptional regulator n=1 Tax=Cellulosilyticum ruminicola TaxID=425254 RepID=UPI00155DC1B3|nr:AraC family transcriptional regulator [Cellulosilyticum ruminicola]
MEIKESQELILENVLSLRKKMTQLEMQQEMIEIQKFINEMGIKVNGPITTATYFVEQTADGVVMDLEIIVPLDKKIELSCKYKFKPIIKIVNALKITHQGNPNRLNDTINKLNQYIYEKQKQVITPTYNVTVKNVSDPKDIEDVVMDIYVGCSPCIL